MDEEYHYNLDAIPNSVSANASKDFLPQACAVGWFVIRLEMGNCPSFSCAIKWDSERSGVAGLMNHLLAGVPKELFFVSSSGSSALHSRASLLRLGRPAISIFAYWASSVRVPQGQDGPFESSHSPSLLSCLCPEYMLFISCIIPCGANFDACLGHAQRSSGQPGATAVDRWSLCGFAIPAIPHHLVAADAIRPYTPIHLAVSSTTASKQGGSSPAPTGR